MHIAAIAVAAPVRHSRECANLREITGDRVWSAAGIVAASAAAFAAVPRVVSCRPLFAPPPASDRMIPPFELDSPLSPNAAEAWLRERVGGDLLLLMPPTLARAIRGCAHPRPPA